MNPYLLIVLCCCALVLGMGCSEDNPEQDPTSQVDMRVDMGTGSPRDLGGDEAKDLGGDGAAQQPALDCSMSRELCRYQTNSYSVKVMDGVSVTSTVTGRQVPLLIRYPTDAPGKRGVVLVSHGGGYNESGHKTSAEWGNTLAAHGFVAIHMAHVDLKGGGEGKILCMLGSVPESECLPSDRDTEERPFLDTAVARPYDAKAVLDDLPRLAARLEDEGVQLDASRVAAAGWSAGSQIGLVLAGAARQLTPSVPDFTITDDRIKASIALSPQGPDHSGYTQTSFAAITGPVLVMTGTNDQKDGVPDLTGAVRRQAYDLLSGGTGAHYMLYSTLPVGTGAHGSYNLGDVSSSDPRLVQLSEALSMTALAFLDAYLLDREEARAWLRTDAPRQLTGDNSEWLQK